MEPPRHLAVRELLDIVDAYVAACRPKLAQFAESGEPAGSLAGITAQLDQLEAALATARTEWAAPPATGSRRPVAANAVGRRPPRRRTGPGR